MSGLPTGRPRRGPGHPPQAGRGERRGGPPRGRRPLIDPAREAAYEAIEAVHRDDAYANLVLPRLLRERGLHGRDAGLATELTYGTLRMTGTLDAILAEAAGRPVEQIDPPVRDALRLGAYQLLYLRVPHHAATSTTVDLVRLLMPAAVGFANAVLRRVGELDRDAWVERVAPDVGTDPAGHLAITQAHPVWIVRAYADALDTGLDTPEGVAAVRRALAANNDPASVTLCARPGRVTPEDLASEVGGARGRHARYSVVLPGGSPGEVASVRQGRAHVQDEGSQLVVEALLAAELGADPRVGARDRYWLDLCAGPGGKAALLGACAAQVGATVTATEIVDHRADLLQQAVRGLPVEVFAEDGRDIGRYQGAPEGGFDRILVDAPCAGLGSLRRRPEARWRRKPGDLPALTQVQRELLGAALEAVRPGGVVAYVTCSPHSAETRATVVSAIRRAAQAPNPIVVERVDVRPLCPSTLGDLGSGPDVQLWPHRHGTDGMYISIMRRTPATS